MSWVMTNEILFQTVELVKWKEIYFRMLIYIGCIFISPLVIIRPKIFLPNSRNYDKTSILLILDIFRFIDLMLVLKYRTQLHTLQVFLPRMEYTYEDENNLWFYGLIHPSSNALFSTLFLFPLYPTEGWGIFFALSRWRVLFYFFYLSRLRRKSECGLFEIKSYFVEFPFLLHNSVSHPLPYVDQNLCLLVTSPSISSWPFSRRPCCKHK